jgi:hypothetical protein
MHGTAQWAALATLLAGSTVLLAGAASSGFAADAVLDLVAAERASHLVVVGDAFALPLADALDAHPDRWPLDALWVIGFFLAIELIVNGWSLVFIAVAARTARSGLAPGGAAAAAR